MMVTILATVTIVSLILTIALTALVVRLLRAERRRSAARSATLAEMAEAAAHQFGSFEEDAYAVDDLQLDRIDNVPIAASGDLFAERESRTAWPRRLAIAVALVAVAIGVGAAVRFRPPAVSSTAVVSGARRRLDAVGAPRIAVAQAHPGHRHADDHRPGAQSRERSNAAERLATALLFAADGSFVASGRAPFDFGGSARTMKAASSSGAVTAAVARYRIGFRAEDGRVIGHVDRRRREQPSQEVHHDPHYVQRRRALVALLSPPPSRSRRSSSRSRIPSLSLQDRRRADQRHGHRHRRQRPVRVRA